MNFKPVFGFFIALNFGLFGLVLLIGLLFRLDISKIFPEEVASLGLAFFELVTLILSLMVGARG